MKAGEKKPMRVCDKARTACCPDPTCWLAAAHECDCEAGTCLGLDGRVFKVRCVEVRK